MNTARYYAHKTFKHFFRTPLPPQELAKSRAIDQSVQFVMFWMPVVVLLGWWTGKPMHLVFGACFLPAIALSPTY